MKHPIHFYIKAHYRNTKNLRKQTIHRIAYAQFDYWEHPDFKLIEQDYDGKDAYLSWIEVRAKHCIKLNISINNEDLFWVYQLKGRIELEEASAKNNAKNNTQVLSEDQYVLFYTSKEDYTLHFKAGHHHVFFYILNAAWQELHKGPEPKQIKTLTAALYKKRKGLLTSKSLSIHAAIRAEILQLATLPKQNGLNTDAVIYGHLAKLYAISKQDLNGARIVEEEGELKIIEEIRRYIEEQVKIGEVPIVEEIVSQFNISIRRFRQIHKKEYGHSLQTLITQKRIEAAAKRLIETEESINNIAYSLDYDLREFRRQFKHQFKESPSNYRKRHQK